MIEVIISCAFELLLLNSSQNPSKINILKCKEVSMTSTVDYVKCDGLEVYISKNANCVITKIRINNEQKK